MTAAGYFEAESPQVFRMQVSADSAEQVSDVLSSVDLAASSGDEAAVLALVGDVRLDEIAAAEADARCQSQTILQVADSYHAVARDVFGDLTT